MQMTQTYYKIKNGIPIYTFSFDIINEYIDLFFNFDLQLMCIYFMENKSPSDI